SPSFGGGKGLAHPCAPVLHPDTPTGERRERGRTEPGAVANREARVVPRAAEDALAGEALLERAAPMGAAGAECGDPLLVSQEQHRLALDGAEEGLALPDPFERHSFPEVRQVGGKRGLGHGGAPVQRVRRYSTRSAFWRSVRPSSRKES